MDNKVRLQYFPIDLSMFLHSTQRSENDELSMLISNVKSKLSALYMASLRAKRIKC